ncbi:MAG: hypothetical protein M1828_006400 [Chrysothrix sp. TS-e1954]|nr:MAG: hypothetical protein M1828_006400 [Chrysothrix sp. TS-e1954]
MGKFSVAVIGGGIGGVVTTIALLKRNIDVRLYEATENYRELGGGIIFGPNTLRIMEKINPEMMDAYHVCATKNAWESKKDIWWEFRHGLPPADDPDAPPKFIANAIATGSGHASAKRPQFLAELVKLIPRETARFGKKLDWAKDHGAEGVEMHFEDGTTERADAVVGCDGIKSCLRRMVLGEDNPASYPSFTGKYAWRALLPMDVARKHMGDEYAQNAFMFLGPHAHVFTLPLEQGNVMQMVATYSKDAWTKKEWMVEADREEMVGRLENWVKPIRDILPIITTSKIWALFDSIPATTFTNGSRICLLGDAAHASTPHQGSGGGMAMEDAFILAETLAGIDEPRDIYKAFDAYDQIRRPRSQRLVKTSREAGELYHLELTDNDADLADNIENRYRWIWDNNPQTELDQAMTLLDEQLQKPATNGFSMNGDHGMGSHVSMPPAPITVGPVA